MDFNKDETLEFKEILDSMSDNNLKNAKITKYVAAIIYAVNNDGTCNIYIPPDTKNIATNIPNKSGELLQIGDSVEVCTKNGKLNNAWIALKHGSSSTKLFDNINVANDATIGHDLTVVHNLTVQDGYINNTHSARVDNSNSYPYHRIAYTGVRTTSWIDNSIVLLLTRGYNGGHFGIVKCDLRTNNVSSSSLAQASATWLVRKGFSADQIVLGLNNTSGNSYLDVFLRMTGAYESTTITPLFVGQRAGFNSAVFTVCDSRETDDSTPISEVYSSITTSTTAPRTYTDILYATDAGTVQTANVASQIQETLIENTGGQTLAIPMIASTASGAKTLYGTTGLSIYHKQGTTSASGRSELVLGNATAQGTAGNKDGTIRLFTQGTGSNYLARADNAHNNTYWNYLPAAGGTLALAPVELWTGSVQSKGYASISNLSNYKKLAVTCTVYNATSADTGGSSNIIWVDLTKRQDNRWCRAGVCIPYSSNHLSNGNAHTTFFSAAVEADLTDNRVYCLFTYNGAVKTDNNYVMTKIEGYLQ